jgi:predicted nicotinamide N-methyase
VEVLKNLNQTIDQLFDFLHQTNQESLLEQLCPYFGTLWPSGCALSEWILSENELKSFKNQRTLELGSGLALPSLLASKLGAKCSVTDFHPEVPKFLEKNCTLNGIETLKYFNLNWQEPHLEPGVFGELDWIFASDVLYESHHPKILADTIQKYRSPHTRVVVTDPGRPYLQSFAGEMENHMGYAPKIDIEKDIIILSF